MKRVFWVRGQRRFFGICWLIFLGAAIPIMSLTEIVAPSISLGELLFFNVLCIALFVLVVLEVFVQRVVADGDGIQAFDILNRPKPFLPYPAMSTYARMPTGDWVLLQGETIYRMPRIDKQQFHAVMAEFAPDALRARLWKCGQLPPTEDFKGLSAFDLNLWAINIVGAAVISAILALFARFFAVFYFASSFLQISYDVKNIFGRISLTSEGVEIRWPWRTDSIQWHEITAVFCERNSSRWSYFVVTAPGRSVTLPSHIFADPELRRKFFYSIPDRTRCVNFDKMRFRRRGKGRKIYAGEEAAGFALDPA